MLHSVALQHVLIVEQKLQTAILSVMFKPGDLHVRLAIQVALLALVQITINAFLVLIEKTTKLLVLIKHIKTVVAPALLSVEI